MFRDYVYPYRNDHVAFATRLLRKVDSEFTELVRPRHGGNRRRLGGIQRCRVSLRRERIECDFSSRPSDKAVVKTLLRAWLRQIPDRYLCRLTFNRFRRRRFRSIEEAYGAIRQNSPDGCVKFLYNELARSNLPVLFGGSLPDDMTYNEYFSGMTAWDDDNCLGLTGEINRLRGRLTSGGGGSVSHILQAAVLWMHRMQTEHRSIYSEVARQ